MFLLPLKMCREVTEMLVEIQNFKLLDPSKRDHQMNTLLKSYSFKESLVGYLAKSLKYKSIFDNKGKMFFVSKCQ